MQQPQAESGDVPRRARARRGGILRAGLAAGLILASCGRSTETQRTIHEVTGDRAHRVAVVSERLAQKIALPSPLVDARQLVLQLGDDRLGPADYQSYSVIEVEKGALDRWVARLTPLTEETVDFAEPPETRSWWISREAFPALKFYEGHPLAPFTHGWVGVAPEQGRLYIFSFTT